VTSNGTLSQASPVREGPAQIVVGPVLDIGRLDLGTRLRMADLPLGFSCLNGDGRMKRTGSPKSRSSGQRRGQWMMRLALVALNSFPRRLLRSLFLIVVGHDVCKLISNICSSKLSVAGFSIL
jgi:hypothetical protein